MTAPTLPLTFAEHGCQIARQAVPRPLIDGVRDELLSVGHTLFPGQRFESLDTCWQWACTHDRARGGMLYNAFKLLPSVHRLSSDGALLARVRAETGLQSPAIADINCRIDAHGEDKYLFDWHQDYWFSRCSPQALVVWVPLTDISPDNGGLAVIPASLTQDKIYRTRAGTLSNSYADAVLLDEEIPTEDAIQITDLNAGDALIFKFNVLHKSLPVASRGKSRFTLQLRITDFQDPEFMQHQYRPNSIKRPQP